MQLRQWLLSVRISAALLLAFCLLLPLYRLPLIGGGSIPTYSWMMIDQDPGSIFLLVVAYFWPVLILLLLLGSPGAGRRLLTTVLEPVLVLISAWFIVMAFMTAFSWQPLFSCWPMFGVLVSSTPALGSWLGLSADALYLLAWLGLLLIGHFSRQREEGR